MRTPRVEWDPEWDQDWRDAEADLETELREERPKDIEKAVEYYRYGFVSRKRQPEHEWSSNEESLYEDLMSGLGEPLSDEGYEESREWFHRGWDAAREPAPVVQEGTHPSRADIEPF